MLRAFLHLLVRTSEEDHGLRGIPDCVRLGLIPAQPLLRAAALLGLLASVSLGLALVQHASATGAGLGESSILGRVIFSDVFRERAGLGRLGKNGED